MQPHSGLDFGMPEGTPIPALANGTIVLQQFSQVLVNVSVLRIMDKDGKLADGGHFYKLAYLREVLPLEDTKRSPHLSIGLGGKFTEENKKSKAKPESTPRIIPVFVGEEMQFVVAYKRFSAKSFVIV
jgi:hypothetical protein